MYRKEETICQIPMSKYHYKFMIISACTSKAKLEANLKANSQHMVNVIHTIHIINIKIVEMC